MKLPRDLSGADVVRALERAGFTVLRQSGSHIRLGKDEVRVTVIAAGFERWEEGTGPTSKAADLASTIFSTPEPVDIFADATGADEQLDLGDDDFDVPSFLR